MPPDLTAAHREGFDHLVANVIELQASMAGLEAKAAGYPIIVRTTLLAVAMGVCRRREARQLLDRLQQIAATYERLGRELSACVVLAEGELREERPSCQTN